MVSLLIVTRINLLTNTPGTDCGNSLACASGQCTSRDLQCKSLMGSYAEGNDTYACSASGCQISCASPAFGPRTCYSMQQNFLEGTPCGAGGRCRTGQCDGSSVAAEIRSWVAAHKPLVIGLSAGLGSVLVLTVLGCCVSSIRRRRAAKRVRPAPVPPQAWSGSAAWRGQQDVQQWGGQGQQDVQQWGGQWQQQQVPMQPQVPMQHPPQAWGQPRSSVRYA